eukprot:760091-Pelagomonas_calceolata.AAC.4
MELASLANFWGRAPKTLHTASSATPSSRFLSFLAQLALALSSYSSTHCMERSLLDVTKRCMLRGATAFRKVGAYNNDLTTLPTHPVHCVPFQYQL